MKIGIDARLFGPKWGGGGLGRYVEELLNELQRIESEHRFVVFLKPENFEACQIVNPRFEKQQVDAHWYTVKEQLVMPGVIKKSGVDFMHFPHWNVPIRSRVPFLVTVHDLILIEDPQSAKATTLGPLRYAIKRAGYHRVLHHAIEKSRHVIAVSEYVKGSIQKHFPSTSPEKISVIYEGVSPATQPPNHSTPVVESPYFLYVGSAYPHKNLESLLHAFSFFGKAYPHVKLVFVGKEDAFYKRLRQEAKEIGVPEQMVIFTGFVPDDVLATLYKNASLYIFPSKHEGFGLPPLEAMQAGVPVASSDRGPLPEVLEDAAVYFDPDNIEQMVGVMERALNDETLRTSLRAKGFVQAQKYSWKKMAEETLHAYERYGGR